MKRFLVMSDSHGSEGNVTRFVQKHPDVNGVIFLGDGLADIRSLQCPVWAVRGNCDGWAEEPVERTLDVDGVKLFLTHGHNYRVKMRTDVLFYRALECDASVALYGHTHIPSVISNGGILMVNPGSVLSLSYAILSIDDDGCKAELYWNGKPLSQGSAV